MALCKASKATKWCVCCNYNQAEQLSWKIVRAIACTKLKPIDFPLYISSYRIQNTFGSENPV